jgi:hypothetical protein
VGPFGSPEAMRAEEDATMREAVTASATGRPRPARARADDGQVAAGLVTCAVLALVALLVWFVVPVSAASDQHSRAQTAAAAAALAAVTAIIRDADTTLSVLDLAVPLDSQLQGLLPPLVGSAGAAEYAGRNNAHVVSYRYDWAQDRAEVVVETNDRLETGEASRARAVAEVGLAWDQCQWLSATSVDVTLTCGHGTSVFYVRPNLVTSVVTLTPPVQYRAVLQARLVG